MPDPFTDVDSLVPPGTDIYESRRQKWKVFHTTNPKVWNLFNRFALKAFRRRPHYSGGDVVHRIRWHTGVDTVSVDDFKISNDHIAYYSRLWMAMDPSHRGGFFEIHRCRGEDFTSTKLACGYPLTEEDW